MGRARSRWRWWRSGAGWDAMDWRPAKRRALPNVEPPKGGTLGRLTLPHTGRERFPNPDVSHPPLHELTHTYGLPLHELTSTSTFALLRAIFAPVAASHTPSSFSLLRSQLARLAPCCRGYSWLVLVFSAARLVFRSRGLPCPCPCTPFALVVLTHGWERFCAPSGERRTRVVWRRS